MFFSTWTFVLYLAAKLSKHVGREELLEGPCLCEMSEAFEVASILVHWYVYHAVQDGENLVLRLEALLELQIFVPEWMRKEVEANRASTSFEESRRILLAIGAHSGMGRTAMEEAEGADKHEVRVCSMIIELR